MITILFAVALFSIAQCSSNEFKNVEEFTLEKINPCKLDILWLKEMDFV